jgi:hypothetical protein
MPLNAKALFDAMESHALSSGQFESVNGHEPKSAPGNGLTAAVWSQDVGPVPRGSGLAITSGLVTFFLRIYQPMLMQPQDAIDPAVLGAVDALFTAYSGDFTLGGLVKNIDLLGSSGTSLRAQAGYLNQDNKLFRVMTITIPLIVNDLWEQTP